MSDHADIVREQLRHLGPFRGGAGEAALDALVAEARVAALEAALTVYVEDDCRELEEGEGLTTEEARLTYSPRYRWGRAALAKKEEACTGGGDCPATTHLHGCYRDDGNCDYPDHHEPALAKEDTDEQH